LQTPETWHEAQSFSLTIMRAVMDGRAKEPIDLAKVNWVR
jgi:hypothetical protein